MRAEFRVPGGMGEGEEPEAFSTAIPKFQQMPDPQPGCTYGLTLSGPRGFEKAHLSLRRSSHMFLLLARGPHSDNHSFRRKKMIIFFPFHWFEMFKVSGDVAGRDLAGKPSSASPWSGAGSQAWEQLFLRPT